MFKSVSNNTTQSLQPAVHWMKWTEVCQQLCLQAWLPGDPHSKLSITFLPFCWHWWMPGTVDARNGVSNWILTSCQLHGVMSGYQTVSPANAGLRTLLMPVSLKPFSSPIYKINPYIKCNTKHMYVYTSIRHNKARACWYSQPLQQRHGAWEWPGQPHRTG